MKHRTLARAIPVLFDLVGLVAAWYATVDLRLLLNPYMAVNISRADIAEVAPPRSVIIALWFLATLWLKSTHRKHQPSLANELIGLVETVALSSMIIVVATFFLRSVGAAVSRSFVPLFVPVSFMCLTGTRYASRLAMAALKTKWTLAEQVAILGDGPEADWVAHQMRSAREAAVTVAGLILPQHCASDIIHPIPVLGTTRQLAQVINHTGIDRIIVAKRSLPDVELDECGAISARMGVVLSHAFAPPKGDAHVELERFGSLALLDLKPYTFTRRQELVKRCFDIVAAFIMLACLAPVLVLAAALIKLTSEGPVFYKSKRVGKGGRYFTFLKFRTMYVTSGRRQVAAGNEKKGHIFKIKDDPRVTPLGRFLRRYSIDEMPQLLNVLRGEMSLVGPRPLPTEDLEPDGHSRQFAFWSEQRSRALPGLTGLWQISGRSDLSFDRMMELDIEYIRNWSLSLDLRILSVTPLVVLTGRGAY